MLLDRERCGTLKRVFVARSGRLVDHVERMLRSHGDGDAACMTLDAFVDGFWVGAP